MLCSNAMLSIKNNTRKVRTIMPKTETDITGFWPDKLMLKCRQESSSEGQRGRREEIGKGR